MGTISCDQGKGSSICPAETAIGIHSAVDLELHIETSDLLTKLDNPQYSIHCC
jgi:hypothetical protein